MACSFPESPASWTSLLRQRSEKGWSRSSSFGGMLRTLRLLPMPPTGCEVVGLLGRHVGGVLGERAAVVVTLFGHRRGRMMLSVQEDTRSPPVFLVEIPMPTSELRKEMAKGVVKIALESETRTPGRRLLEEQMWGVFVNGRKVGYTMRRKEPSEEDGFVMRLLQGVSMAAGVVPEEAAVGGGELSFLRARFERVAGSKDSLSLYMINPDCSNSAELSIFLVRLR